MHIISMIAQKGGAGKSTLAVHLSVLAQAGKKKVALVDLDSPQHSAGKWWGTRHSAGEKEPLLVDADIDHLDGHLDLVAQNGEVDYCIIDTPGRVTWTTERIISLSDLCVIPCQPTRFDLEALEELVEHLDLKRSVVVLNRVRPSRRGDDAFSTKDAREYLVKRYKLKVSPITIGDRVALNNVLYSGKAVNELQPRSVAAKEMKALWNYIAKEVT